MLISKIPRRQNVVKQVALNVGDLNMAGYRSGYNGAVLKTVGGDEPSVGSNPTPAAMRGCTKQNHLPRFKKG